MMRIMIGSRRASELVRLYCNATWHSVNCTAMSWTITTQNGYKRTSRVWIRTHDLGVYMCMHDLGVEASSGIHGSGSIRSARGVVARLL